jgi:hypothetical protein
MMNEFNGPLGQPDPTGMSDPMLSPGMTNGPAEPMMGTQPGMSMEKPKGGESKFRQIYDDFMKKLKNRKPAKVRKIMDIFNKDAQEVLNGPGSSEAGAPPLGAAP